MLDKGDIQKVQDGFGTTGLLALFHCMVRYGSARLGTVRYGSVRAGLRFFSTTSAEVPSNPYRYQYVMFKLD